MRKKRNNEPVQIDFWRLETLQNKRDLNADERAELEDLLARIDIQEYEQQFGPHPNRGKYT